MVNIFLTNENLPEKTVKLADLEPIIARVVINTHTGKLLDFTVSILHQIMIFNCHLFDIRQKEFIKILNDFLTLS